VYQAQEIGTDKQVAVKILIPRLSRDPASVERLRREATIATRLNHPNVCPILRMGETPERLIYLVMPYLEGEPLSEHEARRGPFPVAEGIPLLLQVCQGLAHAHELQIIHRDLKPENVMLTKSGEVKVLDFGLARWLNRARARSSDRYAAVSKLSVRTAAQAPAPADHVAETMALPPRAAHGDSTNGRRAFLATAVGITLGTPLYMSPEQARGETLTPASDMFSFGLLLQVLFTGMEPHPDGLTAREVILRVARGATEPVQGAHRDVTALINRLKQFAPADRLTAVEAVERLRLLEDKPRRIARHAIIGAVLLFALLGAWRYTVDLKAERAIAEAARADAERRRAQADDLINFMVGDLRRKLEPVGRLEIMDDVAERVLTHVSTVRTATLSNAEIVQSAKALTQLGEVRLDQGRSKDALQIFERGLQLASVAAARAPKDDEAQRTLMNSHYSVATVFLASGDQARALEHFRRQLEIAEQMARRYPGSDSWQTELAQAHGNVGTTLEAQRNIEAAVRHYERSLAIKENLRARAPSSADAQADVATARNKIGAAAHKLRRFSDAARQFEQEIAIYERLTREDPRNTVWQRRLAVAHAFRALVLEDTGRVTEAQQARVIETRISQALFDYDRTNVDWRRHLSIAHSRLANLARINGDAPSAVRLYRRAQALLQPLLGADARPLWRRDEVANHAGLSRALLAAGQKSEALEEAQRAVAAIGRLPDVPETRRALADAQVVLADAYEAAGNRRLAAESRQRAFELLSAIAPSSTEGRTLMQWSNALAKVGHTAEAQAIAARLERDGYKHPDCSLCSSEEQ
jgi:eukaryotic-like serine/threonine-protein kinase